MQVWKKNFLITYGMFLIVIYGGFLLLDNYISRNEFIQWVERSEERRVGKECRL